MRTKRSMLAAAVAVVGLLLTSCTVTIQPSPGFQITFNDVITEFRPTRGVGSTYYVGEEVRFLLTVTQPGYITLSAIDPDGSVYVFSRNILVPRGSSVLPLDSQRVVYNAAPPRGHHRIRATFTANPTSGTVVYRGRRGDAEWSAAIELELRQADVRDWAETTLVIR